MTTNVSQPPFLTIRSTLLLFFLVMAATFALLLWLTGIERALLRVLGSVFIVGGFSLITVLLTQLPLQQIVGKRARLIQVVLGLVIGAAMWLPGLWLNVIVNAALNGLIGGLPLVNEFTGADRWAIIVQFGVVIPLLQAFLFFGVLQRGSTLRSTLTGVVLVALLYGVYAILGSEFASSSVLPYFLIGFTAALAVEFTNTIWTGAAVLIGYHIVRPIIDQTRFFLNLQLFLFPEDMTADAALFGGRFLLVVLVCGFVAFLCLQVLRVTAETAETAEPAKTANQPPQAESTPKAIQLGRMWWLPLILIVLLVGVLLYSEIQLRLLNPIADSANFLDFSQ